MTTLAPVPARLPRSVALSYSVGAVGTGVFSTVPGLLLLYYLTEVVGVAAGLAALVLLVPKLWDAALNPVVGTLSDRTSTRWGGRRPYLLAGAIVAPLAFALLFSAPDLGSPNRTALYIGAVYLVAMTGYALFQVPWVAMPAEMTSDYHERTRLMSSRMVLLTLGILIGGAGAPLLSGGKQGGRSGYALMSVVVAVVLAAALLTAWRGTRTAAFSPPDTSPRPTVRAQLALVRSNRSFMPLLQAYADIGRDDNYPAFDSAYLRNVVSAQSFARADQLDALVGQALAAAPATEGYSQGNQLATEAAPSAELSALLIELIGNFGAHSRNAVRGTLLPISSAPAAGGTP